MELPGGSWPATLLVGVLEGVRALELHAELLESTRAGELFALLLEGGNQEGKVVSGWGKAEIGRGLRG